MKKRSILITLALLATSVLTISARERVTLDMGKNFTTVATSAPVDIYLCNNADSAGYVVYDIEPELKNILKVSCSDNTLDISIMKNSRDEYIRDFHKKVSVMKIYLPAPLEEISLTGAGDIEAMPGISVAENLNLRISGAGDIDIEKIATGKLKISLTGAGDIGLKEVTVDNADIKISGAGDIKAKRLNAKSADIAISGVGDVSLDGQCKAVYLSVSGSGDINCRKLIADIATVKVSGSGDIDCYASEMATATCSGSGDIKIYGKPSTVKLAGRKENIKLIK